MSSRHLEALVFSIKAAVSAVVAAMVCDQIRPATALWGAVSAVLVSQTSMDSSVKMALTRVMANLMGAFLGAALSMTIDHQLPALALGVLVTGMACYYLKADDAMRPAFAAVVIVTLNYEPDKWAGSTNRVVGVVIGCLCSLAVGGLFALATGWLRPAEDKPPSPVDHTE